MRTAGIWIERGHVLLESLADRDVWGIPGGSLEPDESVEQGCVREYREELGIEVECCGLALINENFWDDRGVPVREYAFYFWVRPIDSTQPSLAPMASVEGHLKFHWFPLEQLATLTFVPNFLKTLLPELDERTRFLSTRE